MNKKEKETGSLKGHKEKHTVLKTEKRVKREKVLVKNMQKRKKIEGKTRVGEITGRKFMQLGEVTPRKKKEREREGKKRGIFMLEEDELKRKEKSER